MQPGEVVASAGALEDARTRGAHPGWPPAPPHADGALSTYTPEQQRTGVGAGEQQRACATGQSGAASQAAHQHEYTRRRTCRRTREQQGTHAVAAGDGSTQRATQHALMSSRALTQQIMNARVQGGDAAWRVNHIKPLLSSYWSYWSFNEYVSHARWYVSHARWLSLDSTSGWAPLREPTS